MKNLMVSVVAVCAMSVVAEVSAPQTVAPVSPAERIARAGGELIKKGSFTGKVVIVNSQTRISTADVEAVAKLFAEQTECNFVVSDNAVGAAVTLTVIDDANAPTTLLAPEDHWGKVNVANLVADLPAESAKKKFLAPRARKLIIKSLSILCGGGSSQFPDNIMNTATIRQLDVLPEVLPIDMVSNYQAYLKNFGVTPKVLTTYRKACHEGWAPAPTNDVQKAIWEKVHSIPAKPIKIKP